MADMAERLAPYQATIDKALRRRLAEPVVRLPAAGDGARVILDLDRLLVTTALD